MQAMKLNRVERKEKRQREAIERQAQYDAKTPKQIMHDKMQYLPNFKNSKEYRRLKMIADSGFTGNIGEWKSLKNKERQEYLNSIHSD